MPTDVPPIARIRLARSPWRLMALPLVLALIGTIAVIGAWRADGLAAIGLALGGVLVFVGGLAVAVLLLSVRLEVVEAGIQLRWLGGERTYVLARGAVTRVPLRGRNASSLRPSLGAFGWALGAARLRGTEAIHAVLLARTPTAIVVPTEHWRLAIAVADERQLLDAVASAARARQRLEDLSKRARRSTAAEVAAATAPTAPAGVATAGAVAPAAPVAAGVSGTAEAPHALTGIERAEIEDRLAAERAAAERAAAERAAAEEQAAEADRAAAVAASAADAVPSSVAVAAEVSPRRARARRPIPRPGASAAAIVVPALVAGAVWGGIVLTGRVPGAESGELRLAVAALVLAGPGAAVAALMARIWWPRLLGVVAVTALCALLVAGQALLLR